MAITRASGLHVISAPTLPISVSMDSGEYDLVLLEDGRLALAGESQKNTTIPNTTNLKSHYLTILNAANTSHTALSVFASDTATTTHEFPVLTAGHNGAFNVAWTKYPAGALTDDAQIKFYSAAGVPLGLLSNPSTAPGGAEFSPASSLLGNGNYLVTWCDSRATTLANIDTDIMGRIYNGAGVAIGGEFMINAASAGAQIGSDTLGLADGRTLVVWGAGTFTPGPSGPSLSTTGLKGRFVSSTGAPTGAEIFLDVMTASPGSHMSYDDLDTVALGNGGFAVVWSEQWDTDAGVKPASVVNSTRMQVFNAAGAKVGGEVVLDIEAGAKTLHAAKAFELADGGFGVLWQSFNPSVDQYPQSFVRTFNMAGTQTVAKTLLKTVANAGGDGLEMTHDLELMANGKVLGVGVNFTSVNQTATQIFDFGDERLMGNNAANTLYGRDGVHDVMLGLAGKDVMKGLSGNDSIDGGLGNDTMSGGAGADRFLFTTALAANRDTITDFFAPADTIKLDNAVFRAFAAAADGSVLTAGAFWKSATGLAHDANDRIIYNTTTGLITYDVNGSAAGGAFGFAVAGAHLALTNADFVIF
ncbi:MAG: calcium-binding protein [Hyphomicrobium sp.]